MYKLPDYIFKKSLKCQLNVNVNLDMIEVMILLCAFMDMDLGLYSNVSVAIDPMYEEQILFKGSNTVRAVLTARF